MAFDSDVRDPLGRRAFLAAGGALTAGLLLSSPVDAAGVRRGPPRTGGIPDTGILSTPGTPRQSPLILISPNGRGIHVGTSREFSTSACHPGYLFDSVGNPISARWLRPQSGKAPSFESVEEFETVLSKMVRDLYAANGHPGFLQPGRMDARTADRLLTELVETGPYPSRPGWHGGSFFHNCLHRLGWN